MKKYIIYKILPKVLIVCLLIFILLYWISTRRMYEPTYTITEIISGALSGD
jgi:hypothetical protein